MAKTKAKQVRAGDVVTIDGSDATVVMLIDDTTVRALVQISDGNRRWVSGRKLGVRPTT